MAEGGLNLRLPPLNYADFLVRDEDKKPWSWELFNRWMKCFCIVTFDLELGQVIEVRKLNYFLSWTSFFLPLIIVIREM